MYSFSQAPVNTKQIQGKQSVSQRYVRFTYISMKRENTEAFRLLASPTAGNSDSNCKLTLEKDRLRASASNYVGSNCDIVCLCLNR